MSNMHSSRAPVIAAVGVATVSAALFAYIDYPVLAHYGATPDEAQGPLPGDDLVPDGWQCTRALTVSALPEAIWPWLIQMGQDRAGFYSYDWLERIFGAEIHNADRVHPEWQQLTVGDTVWPYPERKLRAMAKRSSDVGGWKVAAMETWRAAGREAPGGARHCNGSLAFGR